MITTRPLTPRTEKPPASFIDHGQPTFSVELPTKQAFGWPLHMLIHWSYQPHSPDDIEMLKLVFSNGDKAVFLGVNLLEIVHALNAGKGGAVIEQSDHGLMQNCNGRAFVTTADLTLTNTIQ